MQYTLQVIINSLFQSYLIFLYLYYQAPCFAKQYVQSNWLVYTYDKGSDHIYKKGGSLVRVTMQKIKQHFSWLKKKTNFWI